MCVFDWFWATLSSLGLYNVTGKLVFLGLDNAGKTTLLHMLRDDVMKYYLPTQKPTMEELTMGNIKFRTYDLGGHEIARRIWREYYTDVDAVVFMVDAADSKRFGEVKKELDELLSDQELASVPFVILGNKIDDPDAVDETQLRAALGLSHTYGKAVGGPKVPNVRPVEVFMCTVANRQGYKEGFQWVSQFIS